jgi:Ca2+-binding RTX toxin-like protein
LGNRGNDLLVSGDDDDEIVWDPGDGSDVLEGENGEDTLRFNGSNADEMVNLSAEGQRLRFFQKAGDITMDCDGVERVIFRALGGADTVASTISPAPRSPKSRRPVQHSGTSDGRPTPLLGAAATNDIITVTAPPTKWPSSA